MLKKRQKRKPLQLNLNDLEKNLFGKNPIRERGATGIQGILFLLLFAIIGIVIYSNTFHSPFVFDDRQNILDNPSIRMEKLSWNDLIKGSTHNAGGRPVAMLSFTINYYFNQYDVTGYHLINIIVHVLNGLLLFAFIKATLTISGTIRQDDNGFTKRDTKNRAHNKVKIHGKDNPKQSFLDSHRVLAISLFSAMLWFVNPLQTNSVTYIVQRMNSLAAFFFLLVFFLYIKGRLSQRVVKEDMPRDERENRIGKSPGRKHYLYFTGAFFSWVLALGCKQTTITLPGFIFLYEWYFFQNLNKRWLGRSLKYLVGILFLLAGVLFIYLGSNPLEIFGKLRDYAGNEFTIGERALTEFRVVIYYIGLLFFPHPSRLNLDYDFPVSHSFTDPVTTLLSFVLILGLLLAAILLAKKERLLSFCIFWFLGNLVIESSIIPLAVIFEHRTYLPSMLAFLLMVILLFRVIRSGWLVSGLLCLAIVVSSIWTYQRNEVWKNRISLWTDNVKKSPHKARPRYNLGLAYEEQGRIDEAEENYSQALRMNPDYEAAHINLGVILGHKGDFEEAKRQFTEALQINPRAYDAHNDLGTILKNQGYVDEAIQHFYQALQINPKYMEAHYNLADSLRLKGRYEEAIKHYLAAIHIDPNHAIFHRGLASAYSKINNFDGAAKHYSEVIRLEPNNAGTYYGLGVILGRQGRLDEAIRNLETAVLKKPDFPMAHAALGALLYKRGNVDEAIQHLSTALKLDPDLQIAQQYLKVIRQEQEKKR